MSTALRGEGRAVVTSSPTWHCWEQPMRRLQPPIRAFLAQMAWGRADALWFLVLPERVTSSTCFWVWGEKVTPTGACFTAGSGPATALWICSADSSFKQRSTNLLRLLMISLIMHAALLLTSLSRVLQHEGPNPFQPLLCMGTHTSVQLERGWFSRAGSEEEERERRWALNASWCTPACLSWARTQNRNYKRLWEWSNPVPRPNHRIVSSSAVPESHLSNMILKTSDVPFLQPVLVLTYLHCWKMFPYV